MTRRDDDYIVESGDGFEVSTRRKGPRERPAADPEQVGDTEREPPQPASSSAGQSGSSDPPAAMSWLGSALPDPPAEPMRLGPSPKTRSVAQESPRARTEATRETQEPTYQYGGEPAGARDPADRDPATTPSILPRAERAASRSTTSRGYTMQIAIAATEFNYDITSMMLERAHEHARFLGADVSHVVRVPGVYDLPFAVKRLMKRSDVDGVVTLGCVIEGETDHDDLVIQHAARKIIDLSLESDKPVGLGITGPGMSRLQAMARIDRAKDAVEAVVRMNRDLAGL